MNLGPPEVGEAVQVKWPDGLFYSAKYLGSNVSYMYQVNTRVASATYLVTTAVCVCVCGGDKLPSCAGVCWCSCRSKRHSSKLVELPQHHSSDVVKVPWSVRGQKDREIEGSAEVTMTPEEIEDDGRIKDRCRKQKLFGRRVLENG